MMCLRGTGGSHCAGLAAPELIQAMKTVDSWAQQWRLQFNPQKCAAICFSGASGSDHTEVSNWINIRPHPYCWSHPILAMWLDQNLVWHYHVHEAIARAKRLLWSLHHTVGRNWTLPQCHVEADTASGATQTVLWCGMSGNCAAV